MGQITDSEYEKFSKQLAQRFERKVKGYYVPTALQKAPLGVRLVPMPTAEDITNIDPTTIKNDEIYFYTKSLKQSVYNLLRHLRNCSSHNNISKKEWNGKWTYWFETRGKNGSPYISMRGNVSIEKWDSFIEDLYATVLKERQN